MKKVNKPSPDNSANDNRQHGLRQEQHLSKPFSGRILGNLVLFLYLLGKANAIYICLIRGNFTFLEPWIEHYVIINQQVPCSFTASKLVIWCNQFPKICKLQRPGGYVGEKRWRRIFMSKFVWKQFSARWSAVISRRIVGIMEQTMLRGFIQQITQFLLH